MKIYNFKDQDEIIISKCIDPNNDHTLTFFRVMYGDFSYAELKKIRTNRKNKTMKHQK